VTDSVSIRPDQTVDILRPDFIQGWIPLLQSTLTGSAASVTFDISDASLQKFRIIAYEFEARTDRAAEVDGVMVRFNADAGANYDYIRLTGNAAAAAAVTSRTQNEIIVGQCEGANSRADCFSPLMGYINSYALADRETFVNQSISGAFGDRSADADINVQLRRGAWQDLSAVISITVLPEVGLNFVTKSLFRLWGIL
jgi:hypothetical protein